MKFFGLLARICGWLCNFVSFGEEEQGNIILVELCLGVSGDEIFASFHHRLLGMNNLWAFVEVHVEDEKFAYTYEKRGYKDEIFVCFLWKMHGGENFMDFC